MPTHVIRPMEKPSIPLSSVKHVTENGFSTAGPVRETRVAKQIIPIEDAKQNVKRRRDNFPPLSQSRDDGAKQTEKKSRNSMSEVVARMRVREKTLMGEDLLKRKEKKTSVSKPPAEEVIEEEEEDTKEQTPAVSPELSPRTGDEKVRSPRSEPRTFRTRKNGIVMPLKKWVSPREFSLGGLEIRGAPVFSRTVHRTEVDEDELGSEHLPEVNTHGDYVPDDKDDSDDEEFDFDEGEAEVEAQRQVKRKSRTTVAVYGRACEKLKIQPAPSFLRQSYVSTMDLRDVRLGPADVKAIAIALVRDSKLMFLDLSHNNLGPIGVSYIAEMLQENTSLFDLNLSATNPGREGIRALSETLRHNKSLEYLRLEENSIEHTESHLLADMIRTVPSLLGLYLGHNKLGYHGGTAIASALEENSTMHTLDLQWNHIRRDSGVALVRALAKNNSLRQLNLAWNGLGKEGCLALAHVLPENSTLRELDLTCNRVDLLSLSFLLKGLAGNRMLSTLKIGQNPITTEGAKALLETIRVSEDMAISDLDITGVPVDEEFIEMVTVVQRTRLLLVTHEEAITLATSDRTREHDGTNLDRYDPVMVLFEYMKLDNLRVIDMFQYMDVKKRDKLSKANIRDGLNTLRIPMTEHAIDVIFHKLDRNKDGYVTLDEMMRVQRDTTRHVKLRQIRAKAKNKEDVSLNGLYQILRDVIAKRTEENESRGESQVASRRESQAGSRRQSQAGYRRDSQGGSRRESQVGSRRGSQVTPRRESQVGSRRDSHVSPRRDSQFTPRRDSQVAGKVSVGRRRSSAGGQQLSQARHSLPSTKISRTETDQMTVIHDEES